MASVTIENLSKHFGRVKAVDNVSLKIEDGEFVVLLGPSGSGKSTILNLVAGLETPTSGSIYIGDKPVNAVPPKDRNIAMVFQSYALYPHMTVHENMSFGLRMHKVPKEEIQKRVSETAEMLGIKQLLDRHPRELSGGQMQRAALGRAIVRNPDVFLMDEPLSNLDAKLRVYMRSELIKLHKESGISQTWIYVTHDQVEAVTMADRIALIDEGVLQQFSSANELYNHPANTFVAGFVGSLSMNFINCELREKGTKAFLDAGSFILPLSDEIGSLVKERSTEWPTLILGIRPEDILVSKKSYSETDIEATVFAVQSLVAEMDIAELTIGDHEIIARVPNDLNAEIGSKIYVKFDESKCHIFDQNKKLVV